MSCASEHKGGSRGVVGGWGCVMRMRWGRWCTYLCALVSLTSLCSLVWRVSMSILTSAVFDDPAIRFCGIVLAMSFLILRVHSSSNRSCRPSQITRVDPWMTQLVTTLPESLYYPGSVAQIGYSGIQDGASRGGLHRKQLTSSCSSVPIMHFFRIPSFSDSETSSYVG